MIIPVELHQRVLDSLHSGHQGVTSMMARVQSSVWWPRIKEDVSRMRDRCHDCVVSAPSQPAGPPAGTPSPDHHFQQICIDFFLC